MTRTSRLFFKMMLVVAVMGCQTQTQNEFQSKHQLPFKHISLQNLADFKEAPPEWKIVGGVQADYQKQNALKLLEGNGVLALENTSGRNYKIVSNLEHGDLELKIDFLISKGSRADVVFQNRYALRGIWKTDYNKALFAPGLWQSMHLLYRAPRFDANGDKVTKAKLEWLYLNDKKIGEHLAFSDTLNTEHSPAELAFSGIEGSVAFKNIRYKKYQHQDSVRLNNLAYKVYEYSGNTVPDFDTLSVIKEGEADSLKVTEHSPKDEYFAMRYTGDLVIPQTGDYLFETQIKDGGHLYIDGKRVAENYGERDNKVVGSILHLEKGTHDLAISYFMEKWYGYIRLSYEGPGMEKRTLASGQATEDGENSGKIVLEVKNRDVQRIGSFVTYHDQKRTHVLTVGTPEQLHYSYDLRRATLLNIWKGPFADATKLWYNRGIEQLLEPLNAYISGSAGIPVTVLETEDTFNNHMVSDKLTRKYYEVGADGLPVFHYQYGQSVIFSDKIYPSEDSHKIYRRLIFQSDRPVQNMVSRLAQGDKIELLDNGLYRVNGRYYVGIDKADTGQPVIKTKNGKMALFIPVLGNQQKSEILYHYIW